MAVEPPSATAEAADRQAQALAQAGVQLVGTNVHPEAQWFPAAGLGLFIHWGLASAGAVGDISWCMLANKPWKDATVTPRAYFGWAKDWRPDRLDLDGTLALAKAAGATYVVMVAKHHDGFTLWPSAYGDLGTKQFLGGRDFVREYVVAARKHGLKVGIYYSPPDWWFDRQYRSFAFSGPALDMDHRPLVLPPKPADHDAKRGELLRGHIRELLTNYGRIDLLWFDGGRGQEIDNAEVRRLQPGIVINRRNGPDGDYGDTEGKLPEKRFSGWFESCLTCWPATKWSYVEGDGYNTAAEVLSKLIKLRAWGGNLLANLGPKGDGSLPKPTTDALRDMAGWMAHSRESVIGAGAGPWPEQVNVPVTTRPGVAYLHLLPGETAPVVWRKAPRPVTARLLRTGEEVNFLYADGALTIEVPAAMRSTLPEVIRLELAQER
jgi:alpha-L-fucosidase